MSLIFIVLICNFFITIRCQIFTQVTSCPSNQYLSSTTVQCGDCPTNTTQSQDGFSCICKPGYYYTLNGGGKNVACVLCATNSVPSSDGWSCVFCPSIVTNNACSSCSSSNQVLVDRDMFGPINGTCNTCASKYSGSGASNTCNVCIDILNTGGTSSCQCQNPANIAKSACLPEAKSTYSTDFTVTNINTTTTTISGYLEDNMLDKFALCDLKIEKGCQSLANMCVMQMYDKRTGSACDYYNRQDRKTQTATRWNNWKPDFPWLYFSPNTVMNLIKVATLYTRTSLLNISLSTYDITGLYLGQRDATVSGYLQLCQTSTSKLTETFRMGTHYIQSCNLTVSQLMNKTLYPMVFYDPYLLTTVNNVPSLYPIPVKINGVKNALNDQNAVITDSSIWALTRRFFLVDNIGSISSPFSFNKSASMITYVSSMRLVVIKQDTSDGQIQVPYLELIYSSISTSPSTTSVQTTFEVVYLNPDSVITSFTTQLNIAMGILCALAGLYGILRAVFWGRRSGLAGFEAIAMLKTILHAASAISNVFLVVIFGVSLYFLIIFKGQYNFSIFLITDDSFFISYLISAFVLKLLEIIHILVSQCTVDIFLIDWERSKHSHAPKQVIDRPRFDHTEDSGDQNVTSRTNIAADTGVSIWRTYFVANEWNEIQTYRKTSLIFNLFVVLLFMEVIGFANVTRQDPFAAYTTTDETYKAPYYRMFRFAVIVSIFGISAFIQWVITITIYERVIEDKLRNYVDMCSVANVSVFVLSHRQFGYYIHGRSVHGSADVSLAQMYTALHKENSGSCAKRGLENDSEQQTYMMALPVEFKSCLNKVYQPDKVLTGSDSRTEHYGEVNKFLDRFLNKTQHPRITFHFQDRKFLEDILDGEFEDSSLEGRFYRDNGTSFGNVLFYGQELALVTFDILLFTVIDLILQNTVLDAVITWIVSMLLKLMRTSFGAKNLATKTLVDKRFLI